MLERDFVNSQDFILSLKMEWTQSLYPQIREKFLALDKVKRDKMNVDDVDELIGDETDYKFFAFCERHLQKLKYSGAYGLHSFHKERRNSLVDNFTGDEPEKTEDFELPETMEGVFALEIRENQAADYTARFGIIEAIHIVAGADEDNPLGLQIAQADEVGAISISGPDKTIGGSLGLEAFKVEMPWQWIVDMFYDTEGYSEWTCEMDDEGNENCYDRWIEGEEPPEAKGIFSVALPGFHGALSYTLGDDAISLNNIGLGKDTSIIAVNGEPIIAIDLNADAGRQMSLSVMADGEDDMAFQITPSMALSVMFAWNKVSDVIEDIPSFLLDETIGINFAGSETPTIKIVNTDESTDVMVASGELRFTSTAMDSDVVISEGQCFVGVDDEDMSEEENDEQHDLFGGFTGGMCGGE